MPPPPTARVLVVDDEVDLAQLIEGYLRKAGLQVAVRHDGIEAVSAVRDFNPDVLVLDLGLPGIDGIEVCRQVRTFSDCHVLMLTARDDEVDKIVGLSMGADDYVTKPFSPRELALRVRTVLRRTSGAVADVLQVGSVRLDVGERRAFAGDSEISLTSTEFGLLSYLMKNPRQVFSREQLLSAVWGYSSVAGTRTVDVHIAQLRAKFGILSPIRTVRGVGYSADAS